MTISPQLVCRVMVRGPRLRIELGGEMRSGFWAAAFVALQRIFSTFSFLVEVILIFGFLGSARDGVGERKSAANIVVTTTSARRFISTSLSNFFLFPLDGSGRLRGHIENYSIDFTYFICDAVRNLRKNFVGHSRPICSHRIFAGDRT